MGRENRALSLGPSFVLVAAAALVACSGRVVTEAPDEPSSGGSSGVGGAEVGPTGSGGQAVISPPPGVAGYGSGGYGAPGFPTPPPATCPARIPDDHSACYVSPNGANECDYGTEDPCTEAMAWCTNGSWSIGFYTLDCGFAGAAGAGGASFGGEAGAAGEGPATADPVIDCPVSVPTVGTACYKPASVTSYRCDYAVACGAFEATCTGYWQLTFRDADSCSAGAPGI